MPPSMIPQPPSVVQSSKSSSASTSALTSNDLPGTSADPSDGAVSSLGKISLSVVNETAVALSRKIRWCSFSLKLSLTRLLKHWLFATSSLKMPAEKISPRQLYCSARCCSYSFGECSSCTYCDLIITKRRYQFLGVVSTIVRAATNLFL